MTPGDPQKGRSGAPGGSASQAAGSAPSDSAGAAPAASLLPALSVPKGGGAMRGIGEKFSVNAATGTASLAVPLAVSPGRSGMGPMVDLTYDSGAGNGPFGLGFHLSVPTVTRKTDKGLPRYCDEDESDEFILSGAEDLVPVRTATGAVLELTRTLGTQSYRVRRYRPRTEGLFANIERWIHPGTRDAHWRVTTRDNVTHVYGLSSAAVGQAASPRIVDPGDARRVFSWLLEESRDDKGNVVRYEYRAENADGVDAHRPSEKSRFDRSTATPSFTATAQRYLKRVLYCNRTPGAASDFLMELVFDYGEHAPFPTTAAAVPGPSGAAAWTLRQDPFSSYRSGFEVRTYRLCRRVLMFHHFSGAPLLVKSTDFTYDPSAAFTYLTGVTQAGYLNDASTGNVWRRDVLPTLKLDYVRAVLNDALSALPAASLEGLEGGVDGSRKQWVDLDGEGIPGVLIDSEHAWYYKSNAGGGELAPPRELSSMPSPAALGDGLQKLEDLGGDGQLDLVSFDEPLQGYFARDTAGGFEELRNFLTLPNIDFRDPNLRVIDLDGDGLPDLLLSEDQAFLWYRSRGKAGFEAAARVALPSDDDLGPAVVFADPEQRVQLADMSGDGLVDIVRVRNGEISYWPNLGYGRFGKKITLENSPVFDHPDQFDARRVRFGDVDGSGTSDLFYLGRTSTVLYRNEAGNGLGAAEIISSFPPVDELTAASVVDLLGQGTATLVWSSPLPGAPTLFYVDLMGGKKPHLLTKIENNLGAETRVSYAASTKFYLEDKQRPETAWLTRLAFPVHVVERLERFDRISKSRLVSSYRYRHGFFDGVEREFRGFARVEQLDAEDFTASTETELFQAPVRTVSWFHTGAWLGRRTLEAALAAEYSEQGPAGLLVRDTVFEADALADPLTIQDEREATRALRGRMLRQEIYAEDATLTGDAAKAKLPYVVTEQNFAVRRLQASKPGKHGVFMTHAREALAIHTERNPADPRITHELVLRVDDFGNVTRKASIAYARQAGAGTVQPEQQQVLTTLGETLFVNRPSPATVSDVPAANRWHRVGVEYETRSYEVTALPAFGTPGQLVYPFEDIDTALDTLIQNPTPQNTVPYDGSPSGPGPRRRLIDKKQQLFYANDLSGPLALGSLESLGLPYESYHQAFTPGLVGALASESSLLTGVALSAAALGAILTSEGGYVVRDGDHYAPSGRAVFDPTKFYLPLESIDAFGNHYFITLDTFALLPTATRDPVGNVASADNDYRVLQPRLVTDPNLNQTEVAFDALGMLVATALKGKAVTPAEGDTLDHPTTRIVYDLLRFQNSGLPVLVHTVTREVHFADSATTRFQERFTYSDGFGRVTMQKVQAEPGPVPGVTGSVSPRWVGTGRTVFNNKGNPVKQYEPFFSATSDFEDEASIVATGVTPIIHYDPLDRVIRTELPDGSESRVEFDAWQQTTFDPNDAVLTSTWYSNRGSPAPGGPEPADPEHRAAFLAAQHANTPTRAHLDTLGRPFLVVAHNRTAGSDAFYETRSRLDVEGNALDVTDPRAVVTIAQKFDVLARRLRIDSPDAGTRLTVADAAGKPLRAWDGRGQTHRPVYDALRRPLKTYVRTGATAERLLLRTVYGEALDPAGVPTPTSPAQALNLRGRPHLLFDCAGLVTSARFDFKGNLLESNRRLSVAYQTEPDWLPTDAASDTTPATILATAAGLLEATAYTTKSSFDALSRVSSHTTPDNSVTVPKYNEANLLEQVLVGVKGAAPTLAISNIDYNARGQRVLCEYANPETSTATSPVVTSTIEYTYDPTTFRLTRLRTTRGSTKLQDLFYTYDTVGNVVELRDQADTTPLFNTTPVSGDGKYVYDAIYRLVSATGREHPGTQPVDVEPPSGTAIPHTNDTAALTRYAETYTYDQVGNLTQVAHTAGTSGSGGWTRNYQYATTSNRLTFTSVPGSPTLLADAYTYDAHGSMLSMPHLPGGITWDYADHMKSADKGGGGVAYFTYDGAGQRVRKVWEHAGLVEERIYLGGYELYRKHTGSVTGSLDLERETLHVMDDRRRVAMAETKTVDTTSGGTGTTRWRFQLDNQLGSALLELDPAGNVISYEEYHPYGSTAFSAAAAGVEVSTKRYRYTGKERDDETGLYYHGARYYAPWLGRWTAVDPKLTVAPEDAERRSSARQRDAGAADEPSSRTTGWRLAIDPYSYCSGSPIGHTDPDGAEPKPIGHVYVIETQLNGKPAVYTGSTAQELRARFSKHEWKQLIRDLSTKITVREVQADLNVKASGRGTYFSARNEALRAGEQKVTEAVAEESAATGRTTLNKQRAATEGHATAWEKTHNVSVGKAVVWKAAGSAFAIVNVLDVYKLALEMRMNEQGFVRTPIVLEDTGGVFTVRYTGLIFRDYFKEYLSGPEKGKSVGISEDEAFFYQRESRALFGDVDWKGDFIPGLLAPEPIEVHTGPIASRDREGKEPPSAQRDRVQRA